MKMLRYYPVIEWMILLFLINPISCMGLGCSRIPQGTTVSKSPVNENYMLLINGKPQTYVPGHKYNVSLVANNGATFISFILSLENDNFPNSGDVGSFELVDFTETRFSPRCPNMVENTNTNIKTHVEIVWIAPTVIGTGCILIRSTVAQHRDVWYMDDGFLTKRICEEQIDDIDSQSRTLDTCCACDEAKYELTFEGKWSRHTHPKDFPANSWRTRFSDIIGASHGINYRFWQYGELASEGLKEIAEHGSTRTLESELKNQSDQIRTIIKARGISFPNITGKTFAVFRVDSKHHLISLVSMVDPSPDWIVGVSGLELCLPNCSWVEYKIHNLYPWDAGTDSGPSYMSADQPQIPPDVIRRIKSNFPNDPRSPFFDPTGTPMKPLATLHINRRRLYEKSCENSLGETDKIDCITSSWSNWSPCDPKCGIGKQYRTRKYKNPLQASRADCQNLLQEERDCRGNNCDDADPSQIINNSNYDIKPERPECVISEWSEWSSCSATCGLGIQTRTREYLNPRAKKKCQKVSKVKLQEQQECIGVQCGGDITQANGEMGNVNNNGGLLPDDTGSEYTFRNLESYSQQKEDHIPPECGVSQWSDFSPCIGQCGTKGQRKRERKVWNYHEVLGIKSLNPIQMNLCDAIKQSETVDCVNPPCETIVPSYCYENIISSHCRDSDVANYWFYDYASDQCGLFWTDKCDTNKNKFTSKESCEATCQVPRQKLNEKYIRIASGKLKEDCLVSQWKFANCSSCDEGISLQTRQVLRSPKYGGKPCPKHLIRYVKCDEPCNELNIEPILELQVSDSTNLLSSCQYSNWSNWSSCTASCGTNSIRRKSRNLLNSEMSDICKDRIRIEKCEVPLCK